MLLQPVVGHDLKGIELEGCQGLALKLLGTVEARAGDDHAAFNATAGNHFHRCACIVERHEAGIGHQADIDLADPEEGDLLGKGRCVDELQRQTVFLRGLYGVGQKHVQIAEPGPVGGLDGAFRSHRGRPEHAGSYSHGDDTGGAGRRRFQEFTPVHSDGLEIR